MTSLVLSSLQDLLSHILLLHQSAQLQQLRQVQTEQWPQMLQVQMHMLLTKGNQSGYLIRFFGSNSQTFGRGNQWH